MKLSRLVVLAPCALAALVAGCTHHGTLTQGALYMSTRQAVLDTDIAAAPDCAKRSVTHTEVVERPDLIVTPIPGTGIPQQPAQNFRTSTVEDPGDRAFSRGVERWTVDRCGAPVNYLVLFEPTDTGNTRVTVTPE